MNVGQGCFQCFECIVELVEKYLTKQFIKNSTTVVLTEALIVKSVSKALNVISPTNASLIGWWRWKERGVGE